MIVVIGLFMHVSHDRYKELVNEHPVSEINTNLISHHPNYLYYDDISKELINATIAIEDRRFEDRYGFDYIAFARAMLTNLIHMSFIEGGSTIEQQFIKIYYFNYESSLSRKMSEYYFVYDLDDNYTKHEIMEMYLNVINYGDGYIGINDAARGYFNKDAAELDLYEASLLAGIPNAPAYLQLSNNNPETYERQRAILDAMLEQEFIDENEYQDVIKRQAQALNER